MNDEMHSLIDSRNTSKPKAGRREGHKNIQGPPGLRVTCHAVFFVPGINSMEPHPENFPAVAIEP
jgi:hypothetical protein